MRTGGRPHFLLLYIIPRRARDLQLICISHARQTAEYAENAENDTTKHNCRHVSGTVRLDPRRISLLATSSHQIPSAISARSAVRKGG